MKEKDKMKLLESLRKYDASSRVTKDKKTWRTGSLTKQQREVFKRLAEQFDQHYGKILDIVPIEVREARGEDFKDPGKLYDDKITSLSTKETYRKRIRTFLKYCVINYKSVKSLGNIEPFMEKAFIKSMADNLGESKGQYSTKTVDSYIDGIYKFAVATSAEPTSKGQPKAIRSNKDLLPYAFKQSLRDMVPDYSRADYKRGKDDGYTVREANIITRQAEKNMSAYESAMVEVLAFVGVRNEELRNLRPEHFDFENRQVIMVDQYMNKQNRPRVVTDVPERVFNKMETLLSSGYFKEGEKIWGQMNDDDVREVVKDCCKSGKIAYSGVHDLRKPYVERMDNEIFTKIEKNEINKEQLVDKLMDNISADPRLNPMVKQKEILKKLNPETGKIETQYYTTKSGKKRPIRVYLRDENKEIIEKPKFSKEELLEKSFVELADLYVAQLIGHADVETNMVYRSEKARERRAAFKKKMKNR